MDGMRGFTLLELIALLAIISAVLSFGVPSFNGMLKEQRLVSEANRLVGGLRLVRVEAARRGKPVTICATANGVTCGEGNDWTGGWLVFEDAERNGRLDHDDALIRADEPASGGIAIHADGDFTGHVTFLSNGRLASGLSTDPNSAFRLCDSRGTASGHTVTISHAGRPQADAGARSCG